MLTCREARTALGVVLRAAERGAYIGVDDGVLGVAPGEMDAEIIAARALLLALFAADCDRANSRYSSEICKTVGDGFFAISTPAPTLAPTRP